MRYFINILVVGERLRFFVSVDNNCLYLSLWKGFRNYDERSQRGADERTYERVELCGIAFACRDVKIQIEPLSIFICECVNDFYILRR